MKPERLKLAILASGGGTDLQSIIDAVKSGYLDVDIKVVISNNPEAYALERARKGGIPVIMHRSTHYRDLQEFRERFLSILFEYDVNFIVLAGYLKKIPENVIEQFQRRIINIHPALLPGYGGKGFYGINVHKAVIAAGDKVSGVTVHFVDCKYDHGEIIYQEKVPVKLDDNPESLAARVLEAEHKVLPKVIKMFADGEIE
ncbi:MAG: phosphoribosylglycinamide formyltransferase [candidate division Zixibacteria bacterium]|nr:phosphoribosylglycinamide formyltransferase [candidate division Zixibacteria bacterium]